MGRAIKCSVWDEPGGGVRTVTYFYYDGANVVAEYAESTAGGQPGEVLRYYVHGTNGIDERAVMHDYDGTDQDHYYLLRELDTVVRLAGENGCLEEGYGYDAYGLMAGYNFWPSDFNADGNVNLLDFGIYADADNTNPTSNPLTDLNDDGKTNLLDFGFFALDYGRAAAPIDDSHEGNRYHFTGRPMYYLPIRDGETITHELRLAHHRARWLDLLHGRWLERDPALYADGMNLYEYVQSDPSGRSDPLGLISVNSILGKDSAGSGEITFMLDNTISEIRLLVNDTKVREFVGRLAGKKSYCWAFDQNVLLHAADPFSGLGRGKLTLETCGDGRAEVQYEVLRRSKSFRNTISGTLANQGGSGYAVISQVYLQTTGIVRWTDVAYSVPQKGMTRLFRTAIGNNLAGDPAWASDDLDLNLYFPEAIVVAHGEISSGGPSVDGGQGWIDVPAGLSIKPPGLLIYRLRPTRRHWFEKTDLEVKWTLSIGGYYLYPSPTALFTGGLNYTLEIP